MNKLKTLCIAALLLFTINTAMAQDSYEYASIVQVYAYSELVISINGKELKKVPVTKEELKVTGNTNPVLREISKMTADGWELFLVSDFYYYLRRKVS